MMVHYLQENIFHLFNKERPGGTNALIGPPSISYEYTAAILFDITDPKNKHATTCIANPGSGQVTYHNDKEVSLCIINYEAFVDLFTIAKIDKKGRSRVDFIVHDTSDQKACFILNELSEGSVQNKLSKARLQLQNTLLDLMKDADVKSYISSFQQKQCILSCRTEPEPVSPLDMAIGFATAKQIIPPNSKFSAKSIERLGFDCIENDHVLIKN